MTSSSCLNNDEQEGTNLQTGVPREEAQLRQRIAELEFENQKLKDPISVEDSQEKIRVQVLEVNEVLTSLLVKFNRVLSLSNVTNTGSSSETALQDSLTDK